MRLARRFLLALPMLVAFGAGLAPRSAHALPSFARQTGEECAACHVGGIGPQLTPHGMKFKLEGYSDGKSPSWYVPVSGQAIASYTNTAKGQDGGAAPHFSSNDNTTLQEASLFVAGRLADGLGTFIQGTYSGVDHITTWDQVDIRYARTLKVSDQDVLVGVTLNNNPTVQDSLNTLFVWNFPYTSSGLTPGYAGTPFLADGPLAQQTVGLTAYGQWNDWVYLEGGAYRSLPQDFRKGVGIRVEDQSTIRGPAPYWRAVVKHSFNRQFASLGVFGMNASVIPDPTNPIPDKYHDVGIDASYQYLGTRRNMFTANGRYTREYRTLYGTYEAGEADNESSKVSEYNINASYYYLNTYGFTVGAFGTQGSTDATLYADDSPVVGKPTTQGMIYQLDYTPFGKEDSWGAPWANLRLGLQYTAYSKFNGAAKDYDGNGRNATDNNTLFGFLWLAW